MSAIGQSNKQSNNASRMICHGRFVQLHPTLQFSGMLSPHDGHLEQLQNAIKSLAHTSKSVCGYNRQVYTSLRATNNTPRATAGYLLEITLKLRVPQCAAYPVRIQHALSPHASARADNCWQRD